METLLLTKEKPWDLLSGVGALKITDARPDLSCRVEQEEDRVGIYIFLRI